MAKKDRSTCKLTRDEQARCDREAMVTVVDTEGRSARGCPPHAVEALDGLASGRVNWDDSSKNLNEPERTALRISEQRSQVYKAR